jgi:ribosomal protein S18 acetylase RimI-like enzyme
MTTPNGFTFALQKEPDLEKVRKFFSQVFSLEGLHPEDTANMEDSEIQPLEEWIDFERMIGYNDGVFLEASYMEDKVIGMAFVGKQHPISWPDGKKAELFIIGILPQFQGQGIGSQLLKACEEHALSIGAHKIVVMTNPEMSADVRFYEKNDFVQAGTLIDYYDNGDCLVLAKSLI